ncbi:MAG: MBL fold metallo-hydrolase [Roseburia sp.]
MATFRIEQFVVGSVQTNCYFVINEDTGEMLIIDPGAAGARLIARIEEEGLKPVAILLTHGHFDHAGSAAELAEHFSIPVYAEEHERETLDDPAVNLSGWEGEQKAYHADIFLQDEQELTLAGFHIRVFHTPGHTVGGCCYFLPYQKVLFSGDTLFAQSMGRTDFPKGSSSQLLRSIREKLMVLPEDVVVYPGHNEETTIGTERMYNPYL